MGFATASFGFTAISAAIGYLIIKTKRYSTYRHLHHFYGTIFASPRFHVFMMIILFSSQLLAVNFTLYHSRIWFFSESDPPH